MINEKWVRQWVVQSHSGPGKHIVSQDKEGNYACACPGWTRNVRRYCSECDTMLGKYNKHDDGSYVCYRCSWHGLPRTERIECTHIREVMAGGGQSYAEAAIDRMLGR